MKVVLFVAPLYTLCSVPGWCLGMEEGLECEECEERENPSIWLLYLFPLLECDITLWKPVKIYTIIWQSGCFACFFATTAFIHRRHWDVKRWRKFEDLVNQECVDKVSWSSYFFLVTRYEFNTLSSWLSWAVSGVSFVANRNISLSSDIICRPLLRFLEGLVLLIFRRDGMRIFGVSVEWFLEITTAHHKVGWRLWAGKEVIVRIFARHRIHEWGWNTVPCSTGFGRCEWGDGLLLAVPINGWRSMRTSPFLQRLVRGEGNTMVTNNLFASSPCTSPPYKWSYVFLQWHERKSILFIRSERMFQNGNLSIFLWSWFVWCQWKHVIPSLS